MKDTFNLKVLCGFYKKRSITYKYFTLYINNSFIKKYPYINDCNKLNFYYDSDKEKYFIKIEYEKDYRKSYRGHQDDIIDRTQFKHKNNYNINSNEMIDICNRYNFDPNDIKIFNLVIRQVDNYLFYIENITLNKEDK